MFTSHTLSIRYYSTQQFRSNICNGARYSKDVPIRRTRKKSNKSYMFRSVPNLWILICKQVVNTSASYRLPNAIRIVCANSNTHVQTMFFFPVILQPISNQPSNHSSRFCVVFFSLCFWFCFCFVSV